MLTELTFKIFPCVRVDAKSFSLDLLVVKPSSEALEVDVLHCA